MPVRTYSSGMYMRLGFSVAMHVNPNVLLLDEVLAVGDEAFQQKCFGRIGEFKQAGGTIVFVSHDPSAVERVCDRAIMLEHGRVVEEGPAAEVVRAYHRRLVSGPPRTRSRASDGASPTGRAASTRCARSRATATLRDRLTEGEPVALEVWLYAEDGDRGRPRHGRLPRRGRSCRSARRRSRACGCGRSGSSVLRLALPRACRCARAASSSTSASTTRTGDARAGARRARARAERLQPATPGLRADPARRLVGAAATGRKRLGRRLALLCA